MDLFYNRKSKKLRLQFVALFVALVVSAVFSLLNFCSAAETVACWSLDDEQCSIAQPSPTELKNKDFGQVSPADNYELVSGAFRFKLTCSDDSSTCDQEGWQLALSDVEYAGDYGGKFDDIGNIRLKLLSKNKSVIESDWKKQNIIENSVKLNTTEKPQPMKLALILNKLDFERLGSGKHSFIFSIMGEVSGNTPPKLLRYTFTFNVPRQVQISGLDEFDFGVFPDHLTSITENLCIYANKTGAGTEGGQFNIEASSLHENGSQTFNMKNGKEFIAYQPYLGSTAGGFTALDGTLQSVPQRGSRQKDCRNYSNKENIALKIDIVESFESLSRKLAGQYSDTITLTVSPR